MVCNFRLHGLLWNASEVFQLDLGDKPDIHTERNDDTDSEQRNIRGTHSKMCKGVMMSLHTEIRAAAAVLILF